jgi:hypothetical protein
MRIQFESARVNFFVNRKYDCAFPAILGRMSILGDTPADNRSAILMTISARAIYPHAERWKNLSHKATKERTFISKAKLSRSEYC